MFNCIYCFASNRGGIGTKQSLKIANFESIKRKFEYAFQENRSKSVVSNCIYKRMPIHFGGLSDPFQPAEKDHEVTYKCLQYLKSINYPIVISTKSTLLSEDKYLKILEDYPNLIVQFSFSTFSSTIADSLEINAYKLKSRMETVEVLSNRGIQTVIRWQPYIPGISGDIAKYIESANNLGVKYLTFEHLKYPIEGIKNPKHFEIINNLRNLYPSNSVRDGRDLLFPIMIRLNNVKEFIKECKNRKLDYGIADNDLNYLSSSSCCCGLDLFEGFENWNKCQISHAIKKSMNDKKVLFDVIEEEWSPSGSMVEYVNSKSRKLVNSKPATFKDYIRDRWNKFGTFFSPCSYFGLEYSGKVDHNGMNIYEWNNCLVAEIYKGNNNEEN